MPRPYYVPPPSSTSHVRLYSENLRPKNKQPVSQLPTNGDQMMKYNL